MKGFVGDARPCETDGKQIVTNTPGTVGWFTWFTGQTDAEGKRGGGADIEINFDTGPEVKEQRFKFQEPVEIHDGAPYWEPAAAWGVGDRYSFCIEIPANTPTSTPGTGNLNEIDLVGGAKKYESAPENNGSHTLDLAEAAPTPASAHAGCFEVDKTTGEVTPGAQGGCFDLFSFSVVTYFMRRMPMCGALGTTRFNVYRAQWVHQNWEFCIKVDKVTAGVGTFAAWLLMFRPGNTEAI